MTKGDDLLMEDDAQDRNTGQIAAISTSDTQAQQVKPPTLNTMIVGRLDSLEGTIVYLADIVQLKNLVIAALILAGFNLAGTVICLVCFGFLFGRFVP